MEKLTPKKEREEHLKWIKWSTIFSGIAVVGSLFSGWMAYNASVSSAQISGKINKENEIESRLYQQKYEFYKSLIGKLSLALNYEMISSGSITGYDGFYNSAEKLLKILKETGPEMRILGGDNPIYVHNCIFGKVQDYQTDLFSLYEGGNDKRGPLLKFQAAVDGLFLNVIGGIWLLENSMRNDLGKNPLPPIYIYNTTGWNPEGKGGWNPIPDCINYKKDLNFRFYIK